MDRHCKRRMILAGALLLALLLPITAGAVELSAVVDSAAVTAGDTVRVNVTVSGENLSVVQGVFTYDPAVLTFVESDGGASDGFLNLVSLEKDGAATLSARITFQAAAAGEAQIGFSLESVLDHKGNSLDTAQAQVDVSIAEKAAPRATAEATPKPIDYAAQGVKAENVRDAQEEMYVWKSLENVTLPSKYQETPLQYHGKEVMAATVPDSDAPTLLYLSNATGDSGSYYVYEEANDRLYPYGTVSSTLRSYILLEPDESVDVPEGFTQTTLTIKEREVMAWTAQDAQGGLYLLYARNPEGDTGFYLYSPEDESLQRYAVLPARPVEPTPKPTPTPEVTPAPSAEAPTPTAAPKTSGLHLTRTQLYLVIGGGALLLVVLVVSLIYNSMEKTRRRRRSAQRRAARQYEQKQKQNMKE